MSEMSEKCKWKDGKFVSCGEAHKWSLLFYDKDGRHIRYCPHCGADIRKPEPEVIIKESGGTWIGNCWGMDFLWFTSERGPDLEMNENHFSLLVKHGKWILFKDKDGNCPIEITDDIAKLRPMVVSVASDSMAKLYAIDKIAVTSKLEADGDVKLIRLATVSDLEES